jgi:hypothetical protein
MNSGELRHRLRHLVFMDSAITAALQNYHCHDTIFQAGLTVMSGPRSSVRTDRESIRRKEETRRHAFDVFFGPGCSLRGMSPEQSDRQRNYCCNEVIRAAELHMEVQRHGRRAYVFNRGQDWNRRFHVDSLAHG